MSLIDGDVVLLHPEELVQDVDGNPVRQPSDSEWVRLRCRVQPVASTEPPVNGQAVVTTAQVLARRWPGGAWATVTWQGRTWDIDGEPEYHPGTSGTAHTSVLIRARTPLAPPEVP